LGPIGLFFGTRPQVIKASVLRETLGAVGTVLAVDTGQHYDYEMHRIHYEQLGVRPPDAFLGVGSGNHGNQTAAILTAAAAWIHSYRPAVAVVIGDTNSTLACALAAAKERIPVAHVEAGLRAADHLMAEEINRRCVDAVASQLFAPSARAARTLRSECAPGVVHEVGDVARDVLERARPTFDARRTAGSVVRDGGAEYVFVTLHRAELVDEPLLLAKVFNALQSISLPVLFAAHPRTAAALTRGGLTASGSVRMIEPLGYLDAIAIERGAAAIVTDSGGVQREAYWLGVPCATVRAETEWVETVEAGANVLVAPAEAERLAGAVEAAVARRRAGEIWDRSAYGEGDAARRIASLLADHDGAGASNCS